MILEYRQHVKIFQKSPLRNMAKYCREQGIDYGKFRDCRRQMNKKPSSGLVPICINTADKADSHQEQTSNESIIRSLSLCFSNGVTIRLERATIGEIQALLNLKCK